MSNHNLIFAMLCKKLFHAVNILYVMERIKRLSIVNPAAHSPNLIVVCTFLCSMKQKIELNF